MNRDRRLPDRLRFRSRQVAVVMALVICLLLVPWVAEAQSNSAPVFTEGASATRSFNETLGNAAVATGSNIGMAVDATDTDAGDTLTYTLEGTDASRFDIISTSGQLRTQAGEKYDYEAKSSYQVTVRVEDSSGGSDTISESLANNPTATLPVPQQQTATCTGAIEDNCDLAQDTGTTGVAVNGGGVPTTGNRYIYSINGVEGWIKPTGDKDWYKIALEGGMNYRVTLFGMNAWGNLDWDDAVRSPRIYGIYNSSGVKMPNTTDSWGAGLDARVYFSPPNDGDYFISVGALATGSPHQGWAAPEGLYRLIVQEVPVDPPANDTTSAVITTTGTVFGEIDRYNDVDWYKLTTTAGRGYRIDMIGGGEFAGDVRDPLIVGVYDTDLNYIVNTWNDNGNASFLDTDNARSYFTASSTGTYYIAVTANGNPYDVVADLGTYRLWVTEIDPDVPDSAHEMTTAVVTEATDYHGWVETLGDRDWIRAELTEDVTYRFTIDEGGDGNGAESINIWGIYHDSIDGIYSGSVVPFNYRGTVEFTPDTTGTYYVSAECKGWGNVRYDIGSYILRMEILSPDNQSAAGVPTIGGTVRVGEELTADTSGITDANGLTNVSYEYQWISSDGNSDVEITNATASTYTVADEDAGRTILVRVTFTDDVGYQETLTSEATEAVDYAVQPQRANTPATGTLTISGTAEVGATLTAITSAIADADGLVNASFDYQWERQVLSADAVTDIPGATGATYEVTSDDRDSAVRVSVSFSDDAENSETLTSYWLLTQAPANNLAAGAPTIGGTAQVGKELTADTSSIADADGLTNVSYEYQWIASNGSSDVEIANATAPTYTVADDDVGWTIQVRVTFTDDADHQETLTSDATEAVDYAVQPQRANTPATGALTISGTAEVGTTLTAITSAIAEADGLVNASFDYQWERQVLATGSVTDIPGATGASYKVTSDDRDSAVRVSVSFSDDAENSETLSSYWLLVLTPPNTPATGAPTISGTAQVGETLTADTSSIADADGLTNASFSYQWIASNGRSDVEIANATAPTYTVADDDEGWTIQVRVSFTDDAGTEGSLTSAATALVQPAAPDNPPDTPNQPKATAVFVGGVDLEWNEVPGADSYDVQQYRGGQWTDLPTDGVAIAFYGAGAIISGLDPEASLWFRVRAANGHGVSDWSAMLYMNSTSQFRSGRQARPGNEPASGAPAVHGTAQVGESLWADASGIEDGNGLDRVQFRYQWVSGDGNADTDIAGATDSGYTLVSADVGRTIKVRVAFTDRGGYSETRTGAATGAVAAAPNNPATGKPAISGTAQVGETLTVATSGIADADGLDNATFSYQWMAGGTEIPGATGPSYTLVSDDEGKTIQVWVGFIDDARNEEALASAATEAVGFAVQQRGASNTPATGQPTISGTAQVGEMLTADTSGIADVDGLVNATYSYQWLGDDTDIAGATSSTYTLLASDEGKTIKVRVIVTDDLGNETTLTSAATDTVGFAVQQQGASNTPATGEPTISGTARVGEMLTANTAGIVDADGLSNATYTYQWVANDGTSDTDISGATDATYTLVADDEGRTIKVRVIVTDDAVNETTLTSAATEAVEAAPEPPAKPTGLSAAVSHDTVTLTWDDPQDSSITGYVILRRDRAIHLVGTFVTITDDTGSTDTTYTDDTVEPDKEYVYRIKASNEHGEVSEESHWVRGFTPAVPVPDKPTGLSAAVSYNTVTLTWDNPQDDSITGYVILRRDREIHLVGTFITITDDTGSTDTTYTDETVEPDKEYVYRIKAINEHGEVSEESHWVRGFTPAAPAPAG